MKADLPLLHSCFKELNELYFKGSLPPVTLKVSNGRSKLGCFTVKTTRDRAGRVVDKKMYISISRAFDLSRQEIENTLIHEMLHYAIHIDGRAKSETPHGPTFRRLSDNINRLGRHHISISTPAGVLKVEAKPRFNVVFLSRLTNGQYGATVVASTKVAQMREIFKKWDLVKSSQIIISTDPFFSRFPRVMTPKIFPISADDYNKFLNQNEPI